MITMYTASICASLLIAVRSDGSCQWNGDGDDGVTDWAAQCAGMDETECGSHAFSRGHDDERCVWVDDTAALSDSIEDQLMDSALPDPSEYGCIWDGTGSGDIDRMAMTCDRLSEAECRAAEDGNKDSRCRWRARVHMGWNMEEEQEAAAAAASVNVVDAVSRWVEENPHQQQQEEHEEEHEEMMEERAQSVEEGEPLGFEGAADQQEEEEAAESVPESGWWEQPAVEQPAEEQPAEGLDNEIPSDLAGSDVDESGQDYSARFDHPKIELPGPAPADPVPADPAPVEAQPVAAQPVAAQPVESQPVDTPPTVPSVPWWDPHQPGDSAFEHPQDGSLNAPAVPAEPEQPQQPEVPTFEAPQFDHPQDGSLNAPQQPQIPQQPAVPQQPAAPQPAEPQQPESPTFSHPQDGSLNAPEQFGHPQDGTGPQLLSSDATKAGVCLWDGTKCNMGDGDGVFMGCDSSKMIQRCAKLQGAQCSGDTGNLYACFWDKGGSIDTVDAMLEEFKAVDALSVKRYSAPTVKVVASVSKVGVCAWNGMGCNMGDGDGVFMGCDSSKMITRCAKLTGALCEGELGETYRCWWDTTGERAGAVQSDHVEERAMNMQMDGTMFAVANLDVNTMDVLLAVVVLLTMAVVAHQAYRWWKGDGKGVDDGRHEYQPLMMDLMENRV